MNCEHLPKKNIATYGDGHWEYIYRKKIHISKNGSLQFPLTT